MRIKDEIFCFVHLRWCHNGWASNILIVVDPPLKILDAHPLWHHRRWAKQKNLIFYSLSRNRSSSSRPQCSSLFPERLGQTLQSSWVSGHKLWQRTNGHWPLQREQRYIIKVEVAQIGVERDLRTHTELSYHIISYHIISYHIISYHILNKMSKNSFAVMLMLNHTCWLDLQVRYKVLFSASRKLGFLVVLLTVIYISHHIISYHIISYHIISYHIISYHIISYHIISYQTIFQYHNIK